MINQVSQLIPNPGPEVWDVDAVSKGQNFFPQKPYTGISGKEQTNWSQYAEDAADAVIAYNLKTLISQYSGAPVGISKVPRNVSVVKGPEYVGDTSMGSYIADWVAWSDANKTQFEKISDPNTKFDAASIYPGFAEFFNAWRGRFAANFDANGNPTVAVETGISTITVYKDGLGLVNFDGYSPQILASTQGLEGDIFGTGDNVIYYTKDTTASTDKITRRGSTIYCRIERDNYATEYTVCDVSGFEIDYLEFMWFDGSSYYLIAVDPSGVRHTFESAQFTSISSDVAQGSVTVPSYSYFSTVHCRSESDNVEGSASVSGVIYHDIRYRIGVSESAVGMAAVASVLYPYAVSLVTGSDSASGSASIPGLSYVYQPSSNTFVPVTQPEEVAYGRPTIHSASYTAPSPGEATGSEASWGRISIHSTSYIQPDPATESKSESYTGRFDIHSFSYTAPVYTVSMSESYVGRPSVQLVSYIQPSPATPSISEYYFGRPSIQNATYTQPSPGTASGTESYVGRLAIQSALYQMSYSDAQVSDTLTPTITPMWDYTADGTTPVGAQAETLTPTITPMWDYTADGTAPVGSQADTLTLTTSTSNFIYLPSYGVTQYITDFSNNAGTTPANQQFTINYLPSINSSTNQDDWYSGLDSSNTNWLAPCGIRSGNYLYTGGSNIPTGYAPKTDQPGAARAFSYSDTGGNVSLTVKFTIIPSTNGKNDWFGFYLLNSAWSAFASIDFYPVVNGGVLSYVAGISSYADDSDYSTQDFIANGPTAPNPGSAITLTPNTQYTLRFDISNVGVAGQQNVSVLAYPNNDLTQVPIAWTVGQVINFANFASYANVNIRGLVQYWYITDSTLGGAGNNQYINYGNNELRTSYLRVGRRMTGDYPGTGFPAYAAAIYQLDETSGTRADLTGTYPMSQNGTVGYTTGKIGNAAVTTTTAWLTSGARIPLAGTAFTVFCWIKPTANQTGSTPNPAVSQSLSGGGGFILGTNNNSSYYFAPSGSTAVTGGTFTAGVWTFIAGRYIPGSGVSLFVNGTKYTGTAGTFSDNTSAQLKIGTQDAGGTNTFQGAVDAVALFRSALTDTQILDFYNATR